MIATRGNELLHTSHEDAITVRRCAFARLVSLHARMSGHEPDPRDLDQWLAAVWPMIEEQGMDPARWARAYLIACGLVREPEPVEMMP